MVRRSKVRVRETYSKMLGEDLTVKLSDDQIDILSKYYNSLDAKETSDLDSQLIQGRNDTDLHEMARNMIGEGDEEDIPDGLEDLLGSIQNEPAETTLKPKVTNIQSSAIIPTKFFGEDKYAKYRDEFLKDTTVGGEYLSNEEKKEGFKSRNDKINFEKFVNSVLDRKNKFDAIGKNIGSSLSIIPEKGKINLNNFVDKNSEETKENIDEVLKGIDSILVTLKEDQKLQKSSEESERKKSQKKKRSEREENLEKKTSPLLKAVEKVIAPVKSLFDKIIQFFTTVFLGRAVVKLLDWYENPENKSKVKSIIRFLGDWWPTILGSYLLFGTQFGRFTRTILSTISKFSFRLLKTVIPALIKHPVTAAVVAAGAAAAGGAFIASQQNEKRRAELDVVDDAVVTPQETREEGQMPGASQLMQEKILQSGMGMAFDGGGEVKGKPGIDKNPAMLTDGEFVMSAGTVQKYGLDTMMAMNAAGGGNNMPKVINGITYAENGGYNGDPADFVPKDFFNGEGVDTTKHIAHNDKSYVLRYNPIDNGKGIEIRQINKVVENAGLLGTLEGKSDKLTGVSPTSEEWSDVINSQAVKKNFATSTGGRSKNYSYPTISTHPQAEIGFHQGRSYQVNKAELTESGLLGTDKRTIELGAASAASMFAMPGSDASVLPGSSDKNAAPEFLKNVSVATVDQSTKSTKSTKSNKPETALEILTRFIMGGGNKKEKDEDNEGGSPRGASIKTGPGYGVEGKKISGELGRYLKNKLKSPRDYSQIHRHPEHPPYNLTSGHSPNSYHYQGRALDIGAYTHEQGKILKIIEEFNKLKKVNPIELIDGTQDPKDHGDHIHVAYKSGGVVPNITPGMGIDDEHAKLTQGESVLQVGARERQISATGVDPLSFNIGPNANKPQIINGNIHAENGGVIQTSSANLAQKNVKPRPIVPLEKSKPKISHIDGGSDVQSSSPIPKGTPSVPYFSASSSDRKKTNLLGIINY